MPSLDGHGPAVLYVSARRDTCGPRLHLGGELDLATAGQLVEAVAALPDSDLASLSLDLSDLAFLDAAGLRALLAAQSLVDTSGGHLHLTGLRPLARRILQITGLDLVLDVEVTDADRGGASSDRRGRPLTRASVADLG